MNNPSLILIASLLAFGPAYGQSTGSDIRTRGTEAPRPVENGATAARGFPEFHRIPLFSKHVRESAGEAFEAGVVDRREQALFESVRKAFPGAGGLSLTEQIEIDYSGQHRHVHRVRSLAFHGPEAVAAAVRERVARYRALDHRILHWELHVIESDTAPWDPSRQVTAATRDAFKQRCEELSGKGRAEFLAAPRIATFNGQSATLQITSRVPYIKDYSEETVQDSVILDPEVDVVEEGLKLDLGGFMDPDSPLEIVVSGSIEIGRLQRPIPQVEKIIGNAKVVIEVPRLDVCTWDADALRLSPGDEGFLVSGFKVSRESAAGGDPEAGVRYIEVWCFVAVGGDELQAKIAGSVESVSGTQVIVFWPAGAVDDEPWTLSPKSIGFYREGRSVGEGVLRGGWTRGGDGTQERHGAAVYEVTAGAPQRGDAAR